MIVLFLTEIRTFSMTNILWSKRHNFLMLCSFQPIMFQRLLPIHVYLQVTILCCRNNDKSGIGPLQYCRYNNTHVQRADMGE